MKPAVISGIRAITLDVGGTLLEPHPGVGVTYAEALRKRGWAADAAQIEENFRAAFRNVRGGRHGEVNEASERSAWREIVRQSISPWCPPPQIDEIFAELWEAFAHSNCWRPLPEVESGLAYLHRLGTVPLYIFSNWDSRLHRVLRALNWEKYFRGVFISTELGAEKPSTVAFAKVQKILGLPPAAILHVGDSLEHDYEGARAAGWQAVLAYPNATEAAGRRTLQKITDLQGHAPFGSKLIHGISPPDE
jgi:putative hydrolase of the HAD superfamily